MSASKGEKSQVDFSHLSKLVDFKLGTGIISADFFAHGMKNIIKIMKKTRLKSESLKTAI